MSESAFEVINSISDIWKITVQAAMFLVLWTAVFGAKKAKRDGIAAALFIPVNIGLGLLPFVSWVRYAVLVFLVMGYGWMNYKRQIGKAVFVMLAFYNLHSLSFLIANSIYMEVTTMMMKELDVLQEGYMQQVYRCMSVGLTVTVFFYTALFVAMTAVLHRLIKGEAVMEWQDVILLSVLNFVGSMIANIISGLITVKIDDRVFLLFDEKPDLLWKLCGSSSNENFRRK